MSYTTVTYCSDAYIFAFNFHAAVCSYFVYNALYFQYKSKNLIIIKTSCFWQYKIICWWRIYKSIIINNKFTTGNKLHVDK